MAKSMIGIKPLGERVLVGIFDDGETTMMLGGKKFYLLGDDTDRLGRSHEQKHPGIRPRWGMILATSDTVHRIGDVQVGDKVLMDQLKWTRGVMASINGATRKVWSIPVEDIMGISDGGLTDIDKEQLARLYPNWETWETKVI